MNVLDLVEELKNLVKIRSEVKIKNGKIIREEYDKAAEKVAKLAESAGLEVEVLDLEVKDGKVPTIIATLDVEAPSLALVSHYDVVPAKGPWIIDGKEVDPYTPLVLEGKLYGRGAADDKSAIVCSLTALEELVKSSTELKYKPVIVVTGDEEIGGLGIRTLLDKGYKWDKALIIDASVNYLSVGASGVVHGWIKVKGRAGHAGYPHTAVNPVETASLLVTELVKAYKPLRAGKLSKLKAPPGSPLPNVWGRFSFTIIKLGTSESEKHNRIPAETLAGFDMRLLPEENVEEALKEFYSTFSGITTKLGIRAELEIVSAQPGWYTTDQKYVTTALEALKEAYRKVGIKEEPSIAGELGGNDGTFFALKGIPVLAYGAIREEENNIHAPGEFVYIKDLNILKEFIKTLLSS